VKDLSPLTQGLIGGDNSGLLSAVEWLRDAKDMMYNYTVLFIVTDATTGEPKKGSSWSWQKQMVGPLETLLHVRSSSQQVRNSIELEMAVAYLAAQKPKVGVTPVSFLSTSKSPAPLSWHLTDYQIKEIGDSWRDQHNVDSADLVYRALGCSADQK